MRKMYVFDERIVDETRCRKDAADAIGKKNESRVEIHKHNSGKSCGEDGVLTLERVSQLHDLTKSQCYAYTSSTDLRN